MDKFNVLLRRLLLFVSFMLIMTACASGAGSSPLGGIDMSAGVLLTVQIVVLVVMLLGLLSLLFVIFPGLTIIWLAALVYGLLSGFDLTSGLIFLGITLLMIFGNMVDQLLMGARAKKSGASWTGVVVSMLAALVFSILFPPFGGLVAALIALFAIETVRLKNWRQAGESTKEMAIGCASAVVARFGIGMVMIGLWLVWLYLSGAWPF
ncbi:DUF456 family protein [Pelolinea submarina]|uniref:DUF456 domain-containing protein n=1 Tax=Pelolinea submarina TaxID=913107 RepID=A0A3E0AIS5_9CHLR|nr:DUF456 domain-containing protein [Pelolinea submarina]REG11523.1 hypothetical protein DFR64_1413 [Pelolinea submarina]